MVKKIVLTLMVMCVVATASAQVFPTWSVEAGVGFSGHTGSGANASVRFAKKITGYVDVPLNGDFSVQAGLGWVEKGARKLDGTSLSVSQHYLELPMQVAWHIGTEWDYDIILTGGAYVAYGIGGKFKQKADGIESTWSAFNAPAGKTGYDRFDAGIRLGVKMDIDQWLVGLQVEKGLISMLENATSRNYGCFVVVGYLF